MFARLNGALILIFLIGGCAHAPADLSIRNVWVHDGSGADPVRAAVTARNGRFEYVGKARRARRIVDGDGLHLVPGLIDVHVHMAAAPGKPVPGTAFISRGVATVRDLGGFPKEVAEAIASDAPHVRAAIQTLNGKPNAPFHRVVTTDAEVTAAINEMADGGAQVIKIHRAFPPELVPRLVGAAASRGLVVTGHIPLGMHPLAACATGIRGVEHVGSFIEAYASAVKGATQTAAISYMLSAEAEPLYRCLADRRVTVTPTLVLYSSIARARAGTGPMPAEFTKFIADMQAITLRLQRSGVVLLAGSDSSALDKPAVDPGSSLLEELSLLRGAGLSDKEVLDTTGANAARTLGLSKDGRLIAPGMSADFLLLAVDPRRDIAALRRPVAIYFKGQPVPASPPSAR